MNLSVTLIGTLIIAVIIIILVIALLINLVLLRKYNHLKNQLRHDKMREDQKFSSEMLNTIVSDFKEAYHSKSEVNTQAIIENHFAGYQGMALFGERFLKHAVSLMIILGLMGTFFGLTLSISGLGDIMTGDLDGIVGNLTFALSGMEVAFNTSLFGIGASVLLTLIKVMMSPEEKRLEVYVLLEDYLDNTIARFAAQSSFDKYEMLIKSMEDVFATFGHSITGKFNEIVDTSSTKMVTSTRNIEEAARSLTESIKAFDQSIGKFNESARDFKEFNYHLRNNIERMSLTFSDFTDDLKEKAKKDIG